MLVMIINDDAGYGIIKYILSMVYICEIPPSSNFCLEDISTVNILHVQKQSYFLMFGRTIH